MKNKMQFEQSISNPLHSRIGRRIILITVILSGAITLIMTLIQLYWDYNREFNAVDQRHYEIESVHAPLLASSLWNFDLVVLQERLDGLVNLPKIDYLQVDSGDYSFHAGSKVLDERVSVSFPLEYLSRDGEDSELLGTIYIESNAKTIYDALLMQFIITLIFNSIKTTFVCILILMVFHESINRRIFLIAKYLRKYNPRHPSKPLNLFYKKWIMEEDDELNWLAYETNKITADVTTLYNNIKFEQERLSDFTHVSSDWLWETDELGKLTYCSESMAKSLSIDPFNKPYLFDVPELNDLSNLKRCVKLSTDFSRCEETIKIGEKTYHMLFQALARFSNGKFIGFRGTSINISDLKVAQLQLETLNANLEHTVADRTADLKQSMEQLQATQEQLIESEKLAALGGLVAGVAHEVNTPLGISVTAASVIRDVSAELTTAFSNQTLTSTQFSQLMEQLNEGNSMLEQNLNRAAKLIKDFKQTAVDQVSEVRTLFNVKEVLDSLMSSLHSETRRVPVVPVVSGNVAIVMNSLPGVLTQIVTNLVMNSINHAFDNLDNPMISIRFHQSDSDIVLEYTDNGSGVENALHQKIFEPFFTSKRGKGGSGLGLNLVFNLLKQKLSGDLQFESEPGQGVKFTLIIPKDLPLSIENTPTE
ncbi:histidine kinase [Vibrio genomosp. F10 str. ZF-129]|uniref:histidine kinase n=1 Tax=Vibrio genomosp. F10 str. ZF-129 TaxID=1187848 RepID=A0A1E5BC67_9VIBR|nr:ATP-binding protein [Vibrio genomosp. F10]OEE31361.1 histidine kinase [Vibrio genomosp. F10 str. ZF-129]